MQQELQVKDSQSVKKPAVSSLRIQNLLSFGEESPKVELGSLNILIGPNGSGKSNLIEIIGLLQSTPRDFAAAVGESGGISECLWKGAPGTPTATLEVVANPEGTKRAIRYRLSFTRTMVRKELKITDERIENETPDEGYDKPYLYFAYQNDRPMLNVAAPLAFSAKKKSIHRSQYSPNGKTPGNIQRLRIWVDCSIVFGFTGIGSLVLIPRCGTYMARSSRTTSWKRT